MNIRRVAAIAVIGAVLGLGAGACSSATGSSTSKLSDSQRAVAACKAVRAFDATGPANPNNDFTGSYPDPVEAASGLATDGSPLSTDILDYHNALVQWGPAAVFPDSAHGGAEKSVEADCAQSGINVWK